MVMWFCIYNKNYSLLEIKSIIVDTMNNLCQFDPQMKLIVNTMTNMSIYSLFELEGVSFNTMTNDQ